MWGNAVCDLSRIPRICCASSTSLPTSVSALFTTRVPLQRSSFAFIPNGTLLLIAFPLRAPRVRQLVAGLFSAAVLVSALVVGGGAAPASAATITGVNQCNGADNVGGQSVECTVTVTNRLDEASSQGSATVEVKECHGAANTVPTCTTTSTESDALVTTVKQCNGSGNGGGGTVDCTVNIVNVVTGTAGTTSAATVNQCITAGEGGGTQPTFVCDPLGSTTNADVTQCNGSGNGGGGSERVTCDVGASVVTSKIPVSVDQCNGSGNGGGATVTCSTTLSYTLRPAAVGPTPTPTPTPTPSSTPPA